MSKIGGGGPNYWGTAAPPMPSNHTAGVFVAYDHAARRFVLPDGTPIVNIEIEDLVVTRSVTPVYTYGSSAAAQVPGPSDITAKVRFSELNIIPEAPSQGVVQQGPPPDRDAIVRSAVKDLAEIRQRLNTS